MQKTIFPLALALMIGGFAWPSAANDMKTILTVRADGTCEIKTDTKEPRATVEREMKMWLRFQQNTDDNDNGDDQPKPDASKKKAEDKPFTDDELIAKLRETRTARSEEMGEESAPKIDLVEITNDTVHTVQTTSLASIEDLLSASNPGREEFSMWSGSTRFEKDPGGRLVVTFTPAPGIKRYERMVRQQIKVKLNSVEVRVVLPGKIISSSYPNVQDNATWYDIDPKSDASITAAMAFYEQPAVIVSEMNGLKLDQPLDSRDLAPQGRRRGNRNKSNELPIIEAGPGFVTEASTVTTITAHHFPEGQKYLKDGEAGMFGEQPGMVVQAKLFAPKGRLMRSVSEVKVTKATDDKGRNVAPAQEDSEMNVTENIISFGPNSQASEGPTQLPMRLRLALPERDAQAIQEIDGEAIAVTFSKWKEITATNLQEDIDLSTLLPGAKMTVKNLKSKNRQTSMQLEITGPESIRELDVKNKEDNNGNGGMSNANLTERGFKTANGQSTRKVYLQYFSFDAGPGEPDGGAKSNPVLVVRFPEEERREHVNFKLTGLDLF